jgi:hypothetical protein
VTRDININNNNNNNNNNNKFSTTPSPFILIGKFIHFPIGCSTISLIIYQEVFEFILLTAVPYYFACLSELLFVIQISTLFTCHVILFVL